VTPLSPAGWRLQKKGDMVSLYPSIGNWNYPCKSHYWIRSNQVQWAAALSKKQIQRVQKRDSADVDAYVRKRNKAEGKSTHVGSPKKKSVLQLIIELFRT
jgi:hypothetical protein